MTDQLLGLALHHGLSADRRLASNPCVARGYKPSGYNIVPAAGLVPNRSTRKKSINYEIGTRYETADDRAAIRHLYTHQRYAALLWRSECGP